MESSEYVKTSLKFCVNTSESIRSEPPENIRKSWCFQERLSEEMKFSWFKFSNEILRRSYPNFKDRFFVKC